MPKAGEVTLIPRAIGSATLSGSASSFLTRKVAPVGHVEIAADAVANEDEAVAFQIFAFNIEEALRKRRTP